MAGIKNAVEGAPTFRASTLRAASSSEKNSLEGGFSIATLQDAAMAYVEDVDAEYRWDDTSLLVPSDPDVIIPLGQPTSIPGRWLLIEVVGDLVGDTNGPFDANETNFVSPAVGGTHIPLGDFTSDATEIRPAVRSPAGGDIDTVSLSDLATAIDPYLPPVSSGQAQYLPVDGNTVGLWTFNRSLADSSGNGNNLSRLLGSADVYAPMCPGLWGAQFDGSTYYQTAVAPVLQLTGEMTLQFIATSFELKPTTQRDMVNCRNPGNTGDVLYWVFSNTTPTIRGQWTGAGPTPAIPVMLSAVPALITLTRNADSSSIQLYVNALEVVSISAAAPTPNPAAVVGIGARVVGNVTPFFGTMCSVRVKNVHSNAAQVAADYNGSLGPVLGTV